MNYLQIRRVLRTIICDEYPKPIYSLWIPWNVQSLGAKILKMFCYLKWNFTYMFQLHVTFSVWSLKILYFSFYCHFKVRFSKVLIFKWQDLSNLMKFSFGYFSRELFFIVNAASIMRTPCLAQWSRLVAHFIDIR